MAWLSVLVSIPAEARDWLRAEVKVDALVDPVEVAEVVPPWLW
jgi:hypothetical protein